MALRALKRLLGQRPVGDGPWRALLRHYPELLGRPQVFDFEADVPGLTRRRADFLTGYPVPGTFVFWEVKGSDSPVFIRRHGTLVPHWTLTLGLQQLEDWKVAIEKYTTLDYLRARCPGFVQMEYRLLIGHTLSDECAEKLREKNEFVLRPAGLHVMTYSDLFSYCNWSLFR
jgi:hypothetical protein